MSGFTIHTSNRLEVLVQRLARKIRRPLASVFDKEIIITQSPGMAGWIAMELAKRNLISANTVFPFPNAFLTFLCDRLSLKAQADDFFDPEILTFRIMKLLPLCLSRPEYDGLRSYFRGDNRQIKQLQVAQKMAHLFDQYLVFRPDLIFAWEKENQEPIAGQAWQADLWREIASGHEHLHRAKMHADIMGKIARVPHAAGDLPERVSVFGISYLPLFHLQVLSALSSIIQVNYFLLNPCRQYWGEVVSDRDIRRIRQKYAHKPASDINLHLDRGNRLISSLGMLGRDFFSMVAEFDCDFSEHYRSPGRDSLLCMVQSDIFELQDPLRMEDSDSDTCTQTGSTHHDEPAPTAMDDSIEIHACHSAMREIEVLYDRILYMFEQDRDLQPKEIMVMAPDIEAYAPYIQAVFDKPADGHAPIPFSLADRTVLSECQAIGGFFSILDLAGSRLEAFKVTELLSYSLIRERFSLSEQDVATIEKWVRDLNIRWGVDGPGRQKLGLPPFEENTWQSGLDRLLLGYAMPGKGINLFSGILPYDTIEGDDARVLGNLMDFFSGVMDAIYALDRPKPLGGWASTLLEILDRMLHTDESSAREIQVLQRLIGGLADIQEKSEFRDPVDFDTAVYYLKHRLQNESFGSGFISGGVTFCDMLPMRSIPFKVICLVGMNGDAFPRDAKVLGFDLMADHPRLGDRSRKNDDKYLFLEALISAEKKFYISYIGRDIQDNTTIAPSVLACELIDYIRDGYGIAEHQMVRQHPLQAFSGEYFKKNSTLFSYSKENYAAAVAGESVADTSVLINQALPDPSERWKNLDADTLANFFVSPVKFFLQNRLGVFLEQGDGLPEERENFRLDGLEGYLAGLESLNHRIGGGDSKGLLPIFKARGSLPHGRVGEHDFAVMALETDDFISRMEGRVLKKNPQNLAINLRLGEFAVGGNLSNVYDKGIVQVRYIKFNAKDLIRLWINHLLLCAEENRRVQPRSTYLCRDATIELAPVDNSHGVLAYLLDLFWEGLSLPLYFFPKSAFEYAEKRLVKQVDRHEALRSAKATMQGNRFAQGELEEPYTAFYFDGMNPLDERFERVSLKIFKPLFEYYTRLPV